MALLHYYNGLCPGSCLHFEIISSNGQVSDGERLDRSARAPGECILPQRPA